MPQAIDAFPYILTLNFENIYYKCKKCTFAENLTSVTFFNKRRYIFREKCKAPKIKKNP